ncbi:MBL fold metallo-hydrolase [Bacillus massiliigorillae]|uniref:MBL fold metallo-hydrolase n=1 Tax=Bacillus massiliigorillae TaxID=1243664 RepID=UPI0003A00FDA|nr:MBL fold metallo-hydrolase [Bacillus massiliigorillae]
MLQFFGCGSAFNTAIGNNNAFMKRGSELFMIDCGSTNFSRMIQKDVLNGIEKITILQTHLHADHVGSLGDLVGYAYNVMEPKKQVKVTIICDKQLTADIQTILRKVGIADNQYVIEEIDGEMTLKNQIGISSIKSYKVQHVPHLNCFAYLLRINDKVVYYSGDCNEIPSEILNGMLAGEIDLFYQDTSKADPDGNVHLSLRKLTELIPNELRHKVYCMHLDELFSNDEAKELGFNVVESL